ncbi:uncharacterized protein BO87DRAFT_379775 [Aspergillus neoniger CBS 115656]|uniref:Guanine nucleotide-exchange factor SEC12 n=1 Tax=Aspergillus neoniger (strain CBS 115656) TaxID=1448310 RepID=A0A318Y961_ASPNB|nr:hypothetical protein BO87DRAFT_379775 [Aspergillus neoniger CBS 115656]PYH30494.1 hypothetical protein BO87DRAFT_379775 [Aspergillus neoniger CBS 115656]
MAPSIPSAKLTLSCPLFAADFDPRHHGLLLVGGGGGEGRSGVGNKIALLNTSKRSEISEVVDINLSRDEDSVTSLAAVQADDEAIVALAGINSSVAEQKRGNNQHLRSFRIDHPTRKEKDNNKENEKTTNNGQTTALSRTSLFRTVKGPSSAASPDTYQRTLRLSPWQSDSTSPRVAAIATGLAPAGEIVFFSATPTPSPSDVIGRIRLNSDEEAEDVDLTPLPGNKGQFRVAYTNGVDICICTISADTRSNASPDVQCVYTTPIPDKGSPRMRPKFRALRFLSSTSLLLLQNAPDRKGCELVLLDLRPAIITSAIATTTTTKEPTTKGAKASILRRKKLRKTIKIGLGLDTCLLSPDPTTNQQQAVIAISGSDQSIELLTLEFNPSTNRYSHFQTYTSLRDVHPFSMTKLCFSRFHTPSLPVSPDTPPQYIKLASVSMGNTVVVHTLPLSPCPPTSRSPRYVLSMPGDSEIWTNLTSSFAAILSILTVCFILQAFTEIRGAMPPYLGAKDWLPPSIRDAVAIPYEPFTPSPSASPSIPTTSSIPIPPEVEYPAQIRSLNDILLSSDDLQQQQQQGRQFLLINCNPEMNTLRIDSTDPSSSSSSEADSGIHIWEDLSEETRHRWISQLTQAGYEPSGEDIDVESIFKGVRFGDLCTEVPIHEEL